MKTVRFYPTVLMQDILQKLLMVKRNKKVEFETQLPAQTLFQRLQTLRVSI